MIKKSCYLLIVLLSSFFSLAGWAANDSPIGTWRSIDDKTQKPRAIITITEKSGKLAASLEKVLPFADEPIRTQCQACKGELKNAPLQGLRIVWDMERQGTVWQNGYILDPKTGKQYRCKMQLLDKGERMKVRGFIGFSLLGRTQIWERIT